MCKIIFAHGDIFLYLICKIFRPWSCLRIRDGYKDKKDTKKVAITGAEMMKKYRGDPKNNYKVDLDKRKRTS